MLIGFFLRVETQPAPRPGFQAGIIGITPMPPQGNVMQSAPMKRRNQLLFKEKQQVDTMHKLKHTIKVKNPKTKKGK